MLKSGWMMNIALFDSVNALQVVELYHQVFGVSGDEEQGQVIGDLVSSLMATTGP